MKNRRSNNNSLNSVNRAMITTKLCSPNGIFVFSYSFDQSGQHIVGLKLIEDLLAFNDRFILHSGIFLLTMSVLSLIAASVLQNNSSI